MKQNKGYKYRAYPTKTQQKMFAKTFGCTRFIYNRMLGDKIDYYADCNETLHITPAAYKDEFEWLKEVDAHALTNAQMDLQTAYKNFFENPDKFGFPKFKAKRNKQKYKTSVCNNNIRIEGNRLKLPKVGMVKIVIDREIPKNQRLKSVTVTQTSSGKYFVSILTEWEEDIKEVELNNFLGLDFSMADLYIDNNGDKPNAIKYYKKYQNKLAREQRKFSKMKKGGNNYHKQRIKVAKIYEKIANSRNDFLHKLSTQITNEYDCICIEDLDLKEISQHLNFGKSVHDNSWANFVNMLDYKLKKQGKKLVKVDRYFPSSKTCSNCGAIKDMSLELRIYDCSCGLSLDRDVNAAINILNEGKRIVGTTRLARECCDKKSLERETVSFR